VGLAVEHEMAEAAREKMFGDELGGVRVIFEHTREIQMRPAKTEINGRFAGVADELRQIVAGAEPREDAVAFPAPGDDLLAGEVGGKMPAVFLREFFNAAVETVVVPAECD